MAAAVAAAAAAARRRRWQHCRKRGGSAAAVAARPCVYFYGRATMVNAPSARERRGGGKSRKRHFLENSPNFFFAPRQERVKAELLFRLQTN